MSMILGQVALTAAAAFTGAAAYINIAEHPARMRLEPRAQLLQWKPSYDAALQMQVGLAVGAALLGVVTWLAGGDWLWAFGALILLANLPMTMIFIMPVNRLLKATPLEQAGATTRSLLDRWARLHAVRTGLGASACIVFILAAA